MIERAPRGPHTKVREAVLARLRVPQLFRANLLLPRAPPRSLPQLSVSGVIVRRRHSAVRRPARKHRLLGDIGYRRGLPAGTNCFAGSPRRLFAAGRRSSVRYRVFGAALLAVFALLITAAMEVIFSSAENDAAVVANAQ